MNDIILNKNFNQCVSTFNETRDSMVPILVDLISKEMVSLSDRAISDNKDFVDIDKDEIIDSVWGDFQNLYLKKYKFLTMESMDLICMFSCNIIEVALDSIINDILEKENKDINQVLN